MPYYKFTRIVEETSTIEAESEAAAQVEIDHEFNPATVEILEQSVEEIE